MKKRDRLGIISLILEASSADAYETKKTTVITYNTLLNHPRLKEYWRTIAKEGLLIYDSTTQTFKTTEKGHKFLEMYSELEQRSREEKKNKTETKTAVAAALA